MSKSSPRDDSGTASRRRFRVRKLALWLLLIPLLFYGVSNLWLSSSWGRSMAEAKLKGRTGMDWQVQGMSWSPWNGFTVRGAKMLQPKSMRAHLVQPLLEVERIQVRPYWGQLFRGHPRIREFIVHAPKITVSAEMLAALASDAAQKQSPPQSNNPQEAVVPNTPVKPQPPTSPQGKPKQPKPDPKPPVKKSTKPVTLPDGKERPPAGLALHLVVKNASIRVVSISKGVDLLDVKNINLNLPVLGEDAEGTIQLGEVKVPAVERMHDIEQTIVWKRPYLEVEEQTVEIDGVKIRYIAQLAIARGAPFLVDMVVDSQRLDHVTLLDRFAVDLQAGKIAGKIKASGALTKPMTWKSSAIVMADQLSMTEKHGDHKIHFDELSIPAVFQRGSLRWSSARVIGEDVSVLGNGSVSVRDGVNSVTRFVVSPEIALGLRRAMNGAHLIKSGDRWWQDLDTPDRKYRDVCLTGPIAAPEVDIGGRHGKLPLWKTLASTLHFIRVEMKEEGVELKPIPNKDLLNNKHHANHQR